MDRKGVVRIKVDSVSEASNTKPMGLLSLQPQLIRFGAWPMRERGGGGTKQRISTDAFTSFVHMTKIQ